MRHSRGGNKAKTGPIETNNIRKSRGISPFWDLGNSVEQIKNLIQDSKTDFFKVHNAKNRTIQKLAFLCPVFA